MLLIAYKYPAHSSSHGPPRTERTDRHGALFSEFPYLPGRKSLRGICFPLAFAGVRVGSNSAVVLTRGRGTRLAGLENVPAAGRVPRRSHGSRSRIRSPSRRRRGSAFGAEGP